MFYPENWCLKTSNLLHKSHSIQNMRIDILLIRAIELKPGLLFLGHPVKYCCNLYFWYFYCHWYFWYTIYTLDISWYHLIPIDIYWYFWYLSMPVEISWYRLIPQSLLSQPNLNLNLSQYFWYLSMPLDFSIGFFVSYSWLAYQKTALGGWLGTVWLGWCPRSGDMATLIWARAWVWQSLAKSLQ